MIDTLKFNNAHNACVSLRIIAERVRTGDARVIFAHVGDNSVIELKVQWVGEHKLQSAIAD